MPISFDAVNRHDPHHRRQKPIRSRIQRDPNLPPQMYDNPISRHPLTRKPFERPDDPWGYHRKPPKERRSR